MSSSKLTPHAVATTLRTHALAYPETTEDTPWGEFAIKVRGKTFLFLRADNTQVSFSVKLPHSAADALELPYVEPTHYGLGKHGWVTATLDTRRAAPVDLFLAWIEESYRSVAPKTVSAKLDAARTDAPAPKPIAKKRSAR